MRRRAFGHIRRLRSGNWQASYIGDDNLRRNAPQTFETKRAAQQWLSTMQADLVRGTWRPPSKARPLTLRAYAEQWLADRTLKPRTRAEYAGLLDRHLLPTFGGTPLADISAAAVRAWHVDLGSRTGPTARAHAYGLLRVILNTAVADELLIANPCRVRGAGNAKRAKVIRPATLPELEALVEAMPEQYRLMVLLAAWCSLRYGEIAELRRGDVDLTAGVLRIRRGVVRVDGEHVVGTPKSDAGSRDVAVPPHLMPLLREHLSSTITGGRDGLLFPYKTGETLNHGTFYKHFGKARHAAGRDDLRFHDLRHTGATLAATTGATIADLMSRLGHSTPGAAMRYQHAAADRDRAIAAALSRLVEQQ